MLRWAALSERARRRVLNHELAHAIAALAVGIHVDRVSAALGANGEAVTRFGPWSDPDEVREAVARIFAFRAGLAADVRLGHARDWPAAMHDIDRSNLLAEIFIGRLGRDALIVQIDRLLREFAGDAEPVIQAVAGELLREPYSLSGAALRDLAGPQIDGLSWYYSRAIDGLVARVRPVARGIARARRSQPVDIPSHPSARGVG